MGQNAKNITYGKSAHALVASEQGIDLFTEKGEPAFLRRLRGQYGGFNLNSPRQDQGVARPKKRLLSEDCDEDSPVYIDDTTRNTLSQEEYDALIKSDHEPVKEPLESEDVDKRSKIGDRSTQGQQDSPGQVGPPPAMSCDVKGVASVGAKKKKRTGIVVRDDEEEPVDDIITKSSKEIEKVRKKKPKRIKISFEDNYGY